MKPLKFCSFGGYRLFCRSWWNDLLWYTTGINCDGWLLYRDLPSVKPIRMGWPGWMNDMYTFYHRGRYGWAPRDTWSLDYYLNRVLGCTLAHLADHTHGSPMGYPHVTPNESQIGDTNHERWEQDLREWSNAFLDMHAWVEQGEMDAYDLYAGQPNGYRTITNMETAKHERVVQTLTKMAPWWRSLWD